MKLWPSLFLSLFLISTRDAYSPKTEYNKTKPEEDFVLEIYENSVIHPEYESIIHSDQALEYYFDDNREAALEDAKMAVEIYPENSTYFLLGFIQYGCNEFYDALDSFIAAHYYDHPDMDTIKFMLGIKKLLDMGDEEFDELRDNIWNEIYYKELKEFLEFPLKFYQE